MTPKVSVLMCVANADAYVAEAIGSILDQSFTDFELLIIENGSTDESWEIITSFKDTRIRALRTQIHQLPFNLNYGLNEARGELIARMDADDIAMSDRLEEQVRFMDEHEDVAVLGSWFEVFGNGIKNATVELPVTNRGIRMNMAFRFVFCHPSTMMRRGVLLSERGYEHSRYCEDLDLWVRMSRDKRKKFANLPMALLMYRVHANQAKGSREAYFSSISILVKEGLMQRRVDLLLGAGWTLVKYWFFSVLGLSKKTQLLRFIHKRAF